MELNMTQIFVVGLGLVCSVLGWFARELYTSMQALRQSMSALEIRIGTDYVRYDRLQDALKPLIEGIKEIKDNIAHRVIQ